jgi:hypothetical protein
VDLARPEWPSKEELYGLLERLLEFLARAVPTRIMSTPLPSRAGKWPPWSICEHQFAKTVVIHATRAMYGGSARRPELICRTCARC